MDRPVCLNCGWEVERNYCSNCGQHVASHNKRLWPLMMEFADEFFRFDSKLFRTLGPLVRKPGFLTKEWAAGKRLTYITPLKLYVTISALSFLIVSYRWNMQPVPTQHLGAHAKLGLIDRLLNKGLPHMSNLDIRSLREHFFSHLPTASLLVIPLAALVLGLFYARRQRNYVEHLVFMLHYNAFCFLVVGFAEVLPTSYPQLIATLWCIGYLPFAMKCAYDQGWGKTLVKFALFFGIYSALVLGAMFGTIFVAVKMAAMLPTKSSPSDIHDHVH